jgi:hypothetical protein
VDPLQRLHRAWKAKPLAITLVFALVPVGVIVLVFGDSADWAFATIGGGGIIIRYMGILMILGGAFVAYSVIRKDAFYEVLGLTFAALGTAVYGVGILLGFGAEGLIAGLGYLSMTLAFLGRVALLCRSAKIAAGEP